MNSKNLMRFGRAGQSLRPIGKRLIYAATLVISGAVLFRLIDPVQLEVALSEFDGFSMAIACALLGLNLLAGAFRYRSILKTFGHQVSLATAIRATLFGLVGGAVFFQVVGQSLSRWQVLRASGVSGQEAALTTLYERLIAAAVLFLLALASALLLYGGVSGQIVAAPVVQKLFIVMVGSFFVVNWAVTYPYLKSFLSKVARPLQLSNAWSDGAWAILVHGLMGLAYVVLLIPRAPEVPVTTLLAAASIVMFAASLPISFSGWGVRELSAMLAFRQVGVAEADAVAVSVAVGVLSLLILLFLAGGLAASGVGRAKKQGPPEPSVLTQMIRRFDYWRWGLRLLPLTIAFLMLFTLRVPLGHGELSANIADPLALLGGLMVAYYWWRGRFDEVTPEARRLVLLTITLVSAGLLWGLVVGYLRFGYTHWAFVNRGLGWIVIVGFFLTGFWGGLQSREGMGHLIPATIAWGVGSILMFDLLFMFLKARGLEHFALATSVVTLNGEAANSNAFSLQMCLAAVAGFLPWIGRHYPPLRQGASYRNQILIAFLAFGISLSLSRTGWAVGAVIGACLWFMLSWRRVWPAVVGALVTIVFIRTNLSSFIGGLLGEAWAWTRVREGLSRPGSDSERLESIIGAVDLFSAHPIEGAGLGGFVNQSVMESGRLLVVHSTPVWLAAELGLVGSAFILAASFFVVRFFLQKSSPVNVIENEVKWGAQFGLLVILVGVLFSLPHDMFFQRPIWYLVGFSLAVCSQTYKSRIS